MSPRNNNNLVIVKCLLLSRCYGVYVWGVDVFLGGRLPPFIPFPHPFLHGSLPSCLSEFPHSSLLTPFLTVPSSPLSSQFPPLTPFPTSHSMQFPPLLFSQFLPLTPFPTSPSSQFLPLTHSPHPLPHSSFLSPIPHSSFLSFPHSSFLSPLSPHPLPHGSLPTPPSSHSFTHSSFFSPLPLHPFFAVPSS